MTGGRSGFDVAGNLREKRAADARWPRYQTSKPNTATTHRHDASPQHHQGIPSSPFRSVDQPAPSGLDPASTRGLDAGGGCPPTRRRRDHWGQGHTVGASACRPWAEIKCRLRSEKTREGPRHGRGFDSPRLHWGRPHGRGLGPAAATTPRVPPHQGPGAGRKTGVGSER